MDKTYSVFQIQNLECSYSTGTGNVVLYIKELEIPRNQLIFVLGPSGGGKSTLLETLGLMNNTISSGKVMFTPSNVADPVDFHELWKKNDQKLIQKIRKEHFGFIFQNTNLMESFTAYENVGLSTMIKNTVSQQEALKDTVPVMNRLGLTPDKVSAETSPLNLSGGQKQRLAFVRALASKSTVLLCDEPTGNLDEINAHELMRVLKESNKNNLSSIVVSHDIDLAIEHADQIVLITLNKSHQGEVKKENIFQSSQWKNSSDLSLNEFKNQILSIFANNNPNHSGSPISLNENASTVKNYFNSLMFKRESISLAGKRKVNLFILPLIIFLSVLGVGFSSGCLEYLELKMKSAFVNWVPINVPFLSGSDVSMNRLENEFLNNEETKTRYLFNRSSKFKESLWWFRDKNSGEPIKFKGRTINLSADGTLLSQEILRNSNFNSGNKIGFSDPKEIGIIVTSSLLESCSYDPSNTDFIIIDHAIYLPEKDSWIYIPVKIPVKAVVNEIPGKNFYCVTEYFDKAWNQKFQDAFDIRFSKSLNIFSTLSDEQTQIVYEQIKEQLGDQVAYHLKSDLIQKNKKGYELNFELKSVAYEFETDSIYEKLIQNPELSKYSGNLVQFHSFPIINEAFPPTTYDYISIYFDKLDSIRSFNKYLDLTFNQNKDSNNAIRMDETQVKEKENFNFLSRITFITSYLLILISALSVSLFVWKVINAHLEKVKSNIGTLTAIGLSEKKSQGIYFFIILIFLIVSSIIAFTLAFLTGIILNDFLQSNLAGSEQSNYFEIFHINTLILFTTVFVFALISASVSISRILSKTPGDLIYNRS